MDDSIRHFQRTTPPPLSRRPPFVIHLVAIATGLATLALLHALGPVLA